MIWVASICSCFCLQFSPLIVQSCLYILWLIVQSVDYSFSFGYLFSLSRSFGMLAVASLSLSRCLSSTFTRFARSVCLVLFRTRFARPTLPTLCFGRELVLRFAYSERKKNIQSLRIKTTIYYVVKLRFFT